MTRIFAAAIAALATLIGAGFIVLPPAAAGELSPQTTWVLTAAR
jgi:hypothetical protein